MSHNVTYTGQRCSLSGLCYVPMRTSDFGLYVITGRMWVVRHYGQDLGCTSLWAGFGLYVIVGRMWVVRHCGQDVGCTSLWAGFGLYVIMGRIFHIDRVLKFK